MIKDLIQQGNHLIVSASSQPYVTNLNQMNQYSGVVAGQMRFNLQSQSTEVFDGMSWQNISGSAYVSLSANAQVALDWAIKKMTEESDLKAKMEKYPTLKAAYEQFKMVEALVHEEELK